MHAGKRASRLAMAYFVREERSFARERVDRLGILLERVAVDRAPVTGREEKRHQEQSQPPARSLCLLDARPETR